MKSFAAALLAVATLLLSPPATSPAVAQTHPLTAKLNAYIECINRLSARSFQSRERYFSWVNAKAGPTGRERIIYGTYTIYDTSGCKRDVEKANAAEPRDAELEAAASGYAQAVGTLEPLLKEADDYYEQENYKDDRMAKGKALHPRLVAAWDAFAASDRKLRAMVDVANEKRALERIAEIEQAEGKKARYHVETLMIRAKRLLRAQDTAKPDMAAVGKALAEYEEIVKATEALPPEGGKVGSMFVNTAKSYLTSSKQLMRRVRDKTPYSQGDRMMINAGSGWMIEGSPQRALRDYNELIGAYNRGANI